MREAELTEPSIPTYKKTPALWPSASTFVGLSSTVGVSKTLTASSTIPKKQNKPTKATASKESSPYKNMNETSEEESVSDDGLFAVRDIPKMTAFQSSQDHQGNNQTVLPRKNCWSCKTSKYGSNESERSSSVAGVSSVALSDDESECSEEDPDGDELLAKMNFNTNQGQHISKESEVTTMPDVALHWTI